MAYSRTTWADYPSLTTPITAARLNNIEAFLAGMSTIQDAWTDYTPTFTNFTIGNGAYVARYALIGKTVIATVRIQFGSTSSITGSVIVSLPVTSAIGSNTTPLGSATFSDTGTATYAGFTMVNATTSIRFNVVRADATYATLSAVNATVPFTFGDTDRIDTVFTYEAA